MYTPAASPAELAAWGLLPSDIPDVEVFEDNFEAFDLFCYMGTQWMVGMGGATGLRYEVAHHKLDRANLSNDEYEARMTDLRIMEQAALKAMRDQRKET
ncbi:DUF1799 domain-containing protein [Duganella sp.]|uniref:DUF1799 domain-containing protein n=1 Tax=Duganella sp. TaxID=1904440 RepID=UPI0031D126CE